MLDIKAAIRYLKSELQGVNAAIDNFETIATEQHDARATRANQRVSSACYRKIKGRERVTDRFLLAPPRKLNPDACLWLQ